MGWHDASSRAGPLAIVQMCGQIPHPRRINGNVVVHEGQHIAPCFSNARVEGIRFSLLGLKQIPEAAGVALAVLLHHSRVRSRELLSTTRISHATDWGSVEAATLSSAFAKLMERLYVHRITVMFIALCHYVARTMA